MSNATVETEYWVSPTRRRRDGIPIGAQPETAEHLHRVHDLAVFAVTVEQRGHPAGVGVRGP